MKCIKSCGSRITLRRALYLAAAQIILALIIAASSHPTLADEGIDGDWHGQVQSLAGPLTVIVSLAHNDKGAVTVGFQVPSQAPGVVIPTTEAAFDGVTLIPLQPLGARLAADRLAIRYSAFSRRRAPLPVRAFW